MLFFFEILLGRILSGITPVIIKLTNANPYEIGIFRLLIATFFFFLIILIQKKTLKYTRANIGYCLIIGLSFGLHWILYFLSIKISTVTIATIGIASYGVFLMILGNLFFQEKINKREVIALFVAIIGSLIVIPSYDFQNSVTIGFLLGLLNALLFAVTATVQKIAAKNTNFQTRIFSQYAFALLVFLPFSGEITWKLETLDWIYLVLLGILGTLVVHTLWIKAVEQLSFKKAGVIYYLSTLFSILAGILILDDPLTIKTLIGGALILLASILATLKEAPKKPALKSMET